jgi:Dolichyl-phosphate-mannose-protein mannosyltransferase
LAPRIKIQIAALILTLFAVVRIVAGYFQNSQAFDEPSHVAAGMEWLDRGTYLIDPLHPPLARIAIAAPLYLAGLRSPQIPPPPGGGRVSYFEIGNRVLYDSGHYLRNLSLARLGILPFFLMGACVVFCWARREFGATAGLLALAMFTTLPGILTFAGLAYTDFPAAVTQLALIFAFTCWLDHTSWAATVRLGLVAGLAVLTKFTTFVFFPAAAFGIFVVWAIERREGAFFTRQRFRWLAQVPLALLICALTVWAGYRFSLKPVIEGLQLYRQSLPTFQHLPGPVRNVARELVARDVRIPAPELAMGVAESYVLTHSATGAYILGRQREGGTWYFFPVGFFFKNPLPFLVLALLGILVTFRARPQWTARAPAAAVLSIVVASMFLRYNAGQRHVLVIYPLFAILAGAAGARLWESRRTWQRVLLIVLLLWQGIESARAGSEPMAYFNELAGRDPSRVLVTGCDLDCGQDVFRLARELRKKHVETIQLALWTSSEIEEMGLPKVEILQPGKLVRGWVAVGVRSLRLGDVQHQTYPPGSFSWLDAYQPVGHAGATILIYCIPGSDIPGSESRVMDVCPR